jgi:hypothetical protein
MATGRSGSLGQETKAGGATRPVNLEGDSPEVVAFALLRYLAQLEQANARQTGVVFDREWLLDAYADCLDAVKGNRSTASNDAEPASTRSGRGRASR